MTDKENQYMAKYSNKTLVRGALVVAALATAVTVFSQPSRPIHQLIPIPEPKNEIVKLEYILNVWKCQNLVDMPDLSWFSNISEDERQALQAAASRAIETNEKVASEMLRQAKQLQQKRESGTTADKLFILAARAHSDSGFDPEQLRRISLVGDPLLKREARKILLLRDAVGRPYSELASLSVPLPDLTRFRGSEVIILFWSAEDVNFRAKWPTLKEKLLTANSQGAEIVSVNFDLDEHTSRVFLASEGLPWLELLPRAESGTSPADYNIRSLPTLWLVDSRGRLVSTRCDLDILRTNEPQ